MFQWPKAGDAIPPRRALATQGAEAQPSIPKRDAIHALMGRRTASAIWRSGMWSRHCCRKPTTR